MEFVKEITFEGTDVAVVWAWVRDGRVPIVFVAMASIVLYAGGAITGAAAAAMAELFGLMGTAAAAAAAAATGSMVL